MCKNLTIVILFFAAAAAKAEPVVSIPQGILGLTGEVVTVPIKIEDATGVVAFDFTINYDTALLDLGSADVSPGLLTDGWSIFSNVNDAAGFANVGLFSTMPLGDVSGSILELDFHIVGSSGKSMLDLSKCSLNEGQIAASSISGSILVASTPPMPGDANVDGRVDAEDALALSTNWLVGPDATWGMGNFNSDGFVDDADAALMAANWHYGVGANASVPEPQTIILLAAVFSALLIKRLGG